MGLRKMVCSLQRCQITTMVACLLCFFISFTSGYTIQDNDVPRLSDMNKRDRGLKMQCLTHPRNCPGGFMLKRNRFLESLMRQDISDDSTEKVDDSVQDETILANEERESLEADRLKLRIQQLIAAVEARKQILKARMMDNDQRFHRSLW